MSNQTFSLRHFRSFRIPVSESDKIRVKIEGQSKGSQVMFDSGVLKVDNMSLSGLAIKSSVKVPKLDSVIVHIEFKNSLFTLPGKLVRIEAHTNQTYSLAVEFDFSERAMSAKFLESFIHSFTGKRLKGQLINLLKSEESAAGLQTGDLYPAVIQMLEEFSGYKDLPGLDTALIEATKLRYGFNSVEFEAGVASRFVVRDLDGRLLGSLKVTPSPRELAPEAQRGVEVLSQLLGHVYDRPECGLHEESVRFLQPKAPRKFVMIGPSVAMGELRDMVSKAKFNHSRVFVTGDFGVGKTLLAKVIHSESTSAGGEFKILDLGQNHSAESLEEYFQALAQKGEGTLVLRELSLISSETLNSLNSNLKKLSNQWRVITTSQLSFKDLCRKFARLDLGHFCELEINVPGLAERREDIPELLGFFVKRECLQRGIRPKKMTKDLVHFVRHMDFDLNIYGLKLFASRMVELNLNAKVLNFEDGHRLGLLEDEQFQLTHFEQVLATLRSGDTSTDESILNEYAHLCALHALEQARGDQVLAMKRLGLESLSELEALLSKTEAAVKAA